MKKLVFILVLLTVFCPLTVYGPLHFPQAMAAGKLQFVDDKIESVAPDSDMASKLMAVASPVLVERVEEGVPAWQVLMDGKLVGYIGSTWEIAGSRGYSGLPLDVLVGIDNQAKITGAILVRHNEPVLTLGISDKDIQTYVGRFAGHDLLKAGEEGQNQLPDIISRATVSTGVIRDSILRTARTLAIGRGILSEGGGINRMDFQKMNWQALLASGALAENTMTMDQAAEVFAEAKVPVQPSAGDFVHFWAGLADPPTIGQNLLGQKDFTQAIGQLQSGESLLVVISSGLYSVRGTNWKQRGIFDRIKIVQGDKAYQPKAERYKMIKRLRIEGAPPVREVSLFYLPAEIDPLAPFKIEVTATKPANDGEISKTVTAKYELPQQFREEKIEAEEPLWVSAWKNSTARIGVVSVMLAILGLVLFAQEWITKRPGLWRGLRSAFLLFTLFVLGWGLNGQLSVVQVVAFLHSLLGGFRWETFLIEPVIFLLWAFVALGLLFWGRGIYCGWLCPFGALQELLNLAAVKLGIKQVAVPQALHERLWIIKYTAFVGIVALSFYSMHDALVLAEIEPFKTAISLRFMRAWPFILFVLVLLVAGLFIERFYCRYVCPLGAGLAIPAKLKVFDWLHRRPQCGRECRYCETQCTVGAIDAIGRINPNECVLCLRCQVIMNDDKQCIILKRRATRKITEAT